MCENQAFIAATGQQTQRNTGISRKTKPHARYTIVAKLRPQSVIAALYKGALTWAPLMQPEHCIQTALHNASFHQQACFVSFQCPPRRTISVKPAFGFQFREQFVNFGALGVTHPS